MIYKSIILVLLIYAAPVFGQGHINRMAATYFVANEGSDRNDGSQVRPFKTLKHALLKAQTSSADITIQLRKGTYYLDQTVLLESDKLSAKSLQIRAYNNELVYLSAGKKLSLQWQVHDGGVYKARLTEALSSERLYINGKLQVLARYPNYDSTARVFNGTAADAIAPERVKKWSNPTGGYVHALHGHEWGGFHYRITGITPAGSLALEGGWQNNRPEKMHPQYRFVENILEELDAPGEWWLDKAAKILYYYPPKGLALQQALVEVSSLKNSIEIKGTVEHPIKNIELKGIHFIHNERSFWDTKEPLLRSDWTIYRGGAVLLDGTENCKISDCYFTDIGGNAIMVSNYNKNAAINGCYIARIGANAVSFIGSADAVRSPSFRYEDYVPYSQMDKIPGPRNRNYPTNCTVSNNLFHDLGKIEKQATGIQIEIADDITASHNTIYNTPRAGINIGDGCFGGHIIEYNDVFNTVLETGDHGAFNSWGRDRFWAPNRPYMDSLVAVHPELILLDVQRPITIRNNRFRCDHGWDIDLDDGSSNYIIYNNVCLNGGLKLREGFYRTVRNNIMINNSFHPHVWFRDSRDVFTNNIVMSSYAPIGMRYWGEKIDLNLFSDTSSLSAARQQGTDANSIAGSPMFRNPAKGDYTVSDESAALKIGFVNFSMDAFGVQKPSLKRIAQRPVFPVLKFNSGYNRSIALTESWRGVSLKSVEGMGDRSAYGLPDEKGVIIMTIHNSSPLNGVGLQSKDVITSADGQPVANVSQFLQICREVNWKGSIKIRVIRNQQPIELILPLK